jgi:hypothetical protein
VEHGVERLEDLARAQGLLAALGAVGVASLLGLKTIMGK